MTQYKRITALGREILYGFDAPTGGYFINEFYNEDEAKKDEVSFEANGICLSDLLKHLRLLDITSYDIPNLVKDFYFAEAPTSLQRMMNNFAGINLQEKLGYCFIDLETNFSTYAQEIKKELE